jgi:hypothetical protein
MQSFSSDVSDRTVFAQCVLFLRVVWLLAAFFAYDAFRKASANFRPENILGNQVYPYQPAITEKYDLRAIYQLRRRTERIGLDLVLGTLAFVIYLSAVSLLAAVLS